jgi:hypothetical protein
LPTQLWPAPWPIAEQRRSNLQTMADTHSLAAFILLTIFFTNEINDFGGFQYSKLEKKRKIEFARFVNLVFSL